MARDLFGELFDDPAAEAAAPDREPLSCRYVTQTRLAVKIDDGDAAVWVPKSRIGNPEDIEALPGAWMTLEIDRWWLEREGLA